jgi:hypothetical protein
MNSRFVYKRGDEVVVDEELVTLVAWINQAQAGMDLHSSDLLKRSQSQEIWPSRLASDLTDRLKKPFSATEAYLIAVAVVKRMEEFEKGFSLGLQ